MDHRHPLPATLQNTPAPILNLDIRKWKGFQYSQSEDPVGAFHQEGLSKLSCVPSMEGCADIRLGRLYNT